MSGEPSLRSPAGESPLRAAVLGCGLIGSSFAADAPRIGVYTHAGAYAACAGTQLGALSDPDPRALEAAGRTWGVSALYRDPAELLADWRPEVVSICAPDATHGPLLRMVLASPDVRAVFMEKPLAASASEAAEILHAAAGRPILVNYFRRFTTGWQALRTRLKAGEIGPIQAVTGLYTKGVAHNGTHWFDLVRWLFGEVREVRAFAGPAAGTSADPTLDVRLALVEDGLSASLFGLPAENYTVFEMDILGASGRVRVTDGGWTSRWARPEPSPHYSGYVTLGAETSSACDMQDAAAHAVENLVACLRDPNVPLACSAADGLAALRIADAARLSARSGEPLPV